MATKMQKPRRELSKRQDGQDVEIDVHFEPIKEEAVSEALDILASMIYDYLRGSKNHE